MLHFFSSKNAYVTFGSIIMVLSFFGGGVAYGETVSGGGYVIEQTVTPLQGAVSGNGYTAQQAAQVIGSQITGGGYVAQPVFGTSTIPAPTPSPVVTISGGGGYFILPTQNVTTSTSTSTNQSIATTSPKVGGDSILTINGSTCSTRIVISQPIDVGLVTNKKDDIKRVQIFLNTYENEKLVIDGIYKKVDIEAVKRWQQKYSTLILAPMKLKKPTGTIYTLSMRQIERQTTQTCGQAVVVNTCPYFKEYVKLGDKGNEVKKVQQFLNIARGEKLKISGKYDLATWDAVLRFQKFYRKDIVNILKLSFMTGNWNKATAIKANEIIGCDVVQ
jgi:peptidoglycan hydrolase-like protein with peptidoglycan-binding domain